MDRPTIVRAVAVTALIATAVVGMGVASAADDPPSTLTGCLNPGGQLKHLAIGEEPARSCGADETEVRFEDSDTTYQAGHGLTLSGTTFSVDESALSVPWGKLSGVPAGFADGVDDDTTYSGSDFATSSQNCQPGEYVTGIDASGGLVCSRITSLTDETGTYRVTLTPGGAKLEGGGAKVEIAGTSVNIVGTTINLNGGCHPVARVGDQVAGGPSAGTIQTGSTTVLSC